MAGSSGDKPQGGDAPRREVVLRLDRLVDAQKAVVHHVGNFVLDATDMTIQGEWSPASWMERYGKMWIDLAKEIKAQPKS